MVRSGHVGSDSMEHSRVLIIRPENPNSPKILHRCASRIAIHPSDLVFAAASDQSIDELNIRTGKLSKTIGDVPGRVLDMEYTADGSIIVACGSIDFDTRKDGVARFRFPNPGLGWVWLYDRSAEKIRKLEGHTATVTSLAIDSTRNRLATSSHDGTVRLWDIQTGKCLHVYRGHRHKVLEVDISSDGKLLASAGTDGIAVWNIAEVVDKEVAAVKIANEWTPEKQPSQTSGEEKATPTIPNPAVGRASWDIVKVGNTSRTKFDKHVDLWLQENGKASQAVEIENAPRPSPSRQVPSNLRGPFGKSVDGKRLLFSSKESVTVLDSDYRKIQSWPVKNSRISSAISRDGGRVYISREGHRDNDLHRGIIIEVYDVQTGELVTKIQDMDAKWGTGLRVDPLGRTLLTRFDGNSLDLREIATGRSLNTLKFTAGGARLDVRYSPDGRMIATCKFPETKIVLRNPLTLEPIQTVENDLPVSWYKFTPDGTRLLVGQRYATSRELLTMWEIDDSKLLNIRRLWSHAGPARGAGMFSDDGRRFLAYANSKMWTLWDTEIGAVKAAIITSYGSVDKFSLSADGRSIHFYSRDGSLVWQEESAAD